jgi:glycosyltransferase involved in cell wall biosynthesis
MDKQTKRLKSLAVVLPRYAKSLGGGAETLISNLVFALKDFSRTGEFSEFLDPELNVEIWTTCALDHRTWENHFPAGVTEEDGFTVRRFPVDKRNLEIFIKAEHQMRDGLPLSVDQQLDWLKESVNSSELYQHIAEHGEHFQSILFGPYLFATSFWGALIHPDRSLLLPCLHNEHYAYQQIFHFLFNRVKGLVFNASPEADLASELYGSCDEKSEVVGLGFDVPERTVSEKTWKELINKNPFLAEPYLLYSGRKEQGKNLDLLIDYYEKYRREFPENKINFVMIGSGEVNFLETLPDGVRDLGFVTEEEKLALMSHSLFLCQPSINESFSIVIMEAWLEKVAVVVHGNCAVTRHHVTQSGGGLYFSNLADFYGVVNKLLSEKGLGSKLGQAGYDYVCREYNWPEVIKRFCLLLQKLEIVQIANVQNPTNITHISRSAN